VKHWITLNEPHTVAIQGYDAGLQAPGRCSLLLHLYCKLGNSGTEPYIVAHNFILAHATVSDIYRRNYKVSTSLYTCNKNVTQFHFDLSQRQGS
jgi:beta-glucosidase